MQKKILKNFFSVELNSFEKEIALEAVKEKYAKALTRAIGFSILSILPILFLETDTIVSVLIPVTMVSGTAWFAISLANMKQKFEKFGLELTVNLFESFSISLGILLMLAIFSLAKPFWQNIVLSLNYQNIFFVISFIIGTVIIVDIIYKIFIGSIKYDINDSMLTGQNEAAEKFYRKALSLLHSISTSLREGKSIQVANYYIGVAFFEIFSYMKEITNMNGEMSDYIEKSNQLVRNPSMKQKDADSISLDLIKKWHSYCVNPVGYESKKSMEAINDELWCLENNKKEDQEMVDTRLAVIFTEIADLMENQGETLFRKK